MRGLTKLLWALMSSMAGPAWASWAKKQPISTAQITLQSMITDKKMRKTNKFVLDFF